LAVSEVAEIRGGDSLYSRLTDRKPDEAADGSYQLNGVPGGLPMSLFDMKVSRGIGQSPGAAISWHLDGKFRSFIAHAGVPLTVLPGTSTQFVVIADGKEVFRSRPLTSIDDPVPVSVKLNGVRMLTLRVESSPTSHAVPGIWADPLCVNR
ncbi:MAG: NPCBM/NEW2 domain-containing protein, partial [Phycisphaerae bacterium]|nr:NPCBM/NEW2 domain-containing protein [Phycisphaerae bacterium]